MKARAVTVGIPVRDIEQAVESKIRTNAGRYPTEQWTGRAGRADEKGT